MPEDDLYALPLEAFIAARDKTAREVRKAGDRDEAARIAKLAKPTPAAWAANQVAREQPELIEALLDAGAALRAAQDAAMSGGGARQLREATIAERRAVDAVMAAAGALRPAGKPLSRAMAERLRTTLHAAAGDPAIRAALVAGRLVTEAQGGGAWPFALEGGGDPAPAAPARKRGARTAPDEGAAGDDDAADEGAADGGDDAADEGAAGAGDTATATAATREEAKARAAAERDAAKAREAAEREEAKAREAAEREARKALEAELREARGSLRVRERVAAGAQEDADAAQAALAEAQERLQAAQRALEDAQAEAEAATRVLAGARKDLDQARDTVARLEERLD